MTRSIFTQSKSIYPRLVLPPSFFPKYWQLALKPMQAWAHPPEATQEGTLIFTVPVIISISNQLIISAAGCLFGRVWQSLTSSFSVSRISVWGWLAGVNAALVRGVSKAAPLVGHADVLALTRPLESRPLASLCRHGLRGQQEARDGRYRGREGVCFCHWERYDD